MCRGGKVMKKDFIEGIHWIDLLIDFRYFFKCYLLKKDKSENYSLKEYVKPYLQKKTFSVLSWKDPLPFLMQLFYIVKNISKKL